MTKIKVEPLWTECQPSLAEICLAQAPPNPSILELQATCIAALTLLAGLPIRLHHPITSLFDSFVRQPFLYGNKFDYFMVYDHLCAIFSFCYPYRKKPFLNSVPSYDLENINLLELKFVSSFFCLIKCFKLVEIVKYSNFSKISEKTLNL